MTSRMLKQSDNFKLLHKCSPSQRKVFLKSTNPALIHAICNCITNIIHQKILITVKQKRALAKKKSVLRALSNSRAKTPRKENLLIQNWWDIKNYSGRDIECPCVIMSVTHGKKLLVIPSDMCDMIKKHSAKSYQPEKNQLIKPEEEMQKVVL